MHLFRWYSRELGGKTKELGVLQQLSFWLLQEQVDRHIPHHIGMELFSQHTCIFRFSRVGAAAAKVAVCDIPMGLH